jgi:hypothetical protein
VFNGPFIVGDTLIIEQQDESKPLFRIEWNLKDARISTAIIVKFYNSLNKKYCNYFLNITDSFACLYDNNISTYVHQYNVGGSGKLSIEK